MSTQFHISRSAVRPPSKVKELKKVVKSLIDAFPPSGEIEVLAAIGKAKRASYDDPEFRTEFTHPPDLTPYLLHEPIKLRHQISATDVLPVEIAATFPSTSRIGISRSLKVNLDGDHPPFVVRTRFAGSGDHFHFGIGLLFSERDIPAYWPVKDHSEFWTAVAAWYNSSLWPQLGYSDQITTTVVSNNQEFRLKHESNQKFRDDPSIKLQAKGNPYHEMLLLTNSLEHSHEIFLTASELGETVDDDLMLSLEYPDKKAYLNERKTLKKFGNAWSSSVRSTFIKTKDPYLRPARIAKGDPPQWTVAATIYGGESFVNIVHEKEGSFLEFYSQKPKQWVIDAWAFAEEEPEWYSENPSSRCGE